MKISKHSLLVGVMALAGTLGGCQDMNKKNGPKPDQLPTFYDDIVWVSLVVDLPLIDEDRDQQPDGAQVRVMLLRSNQPDYVAGKGRVNFYLMKRVRSAAGTFENVPLYKWNISEDDFARSVVRQRYGFVCHQIALYWGNLRPRGSGIYMKVEFVRTDGKTIMSRPVSLAIPSTSNIGTGK